MKSVFIVITLIASIASAEECGKQKSANAFVFGGSAVSVGDHPWIVPLIRKYNDKFFCGSNLISRQHVLTGKRASIELKCCNGNVDIFFQPPIAS